MKPASTSEKNMGEDGPPMCGGAGENKKVPDHVQHTCCWIL